MNNYMKLSQDQVKTILNNAPAGTDKKKILDGLINRGYELEGVDTAAAKQAMQPAEPATRTGYADRTKETVGDVTGIVSDIRESSTQRSQNIDEAQQRFNKGEQGLASTVLQTIGQYAGSGADAIGATFKGAANTLLSDKTEKDITDVISKYGAKAMANPGVQRIINSYNELPSEQQANIDAAGGIVSLVGEFVGAGVGSKAASATARGVRTAGTKSMNMANDAANTVSKTAQDALDTVSTATQGIRGAAGELIERVPRAVSKLKQASVDATTRAERIATSTPKVANAIKANLDDNVLNRVVNADDVTRSDYNRILEIAETGDKKVRPEIVAGEAAARQYKIIDGKRKSVGSSLGDEVKKLSKKGRVDVSDSVTEVNKVLNEQGVSIGIKDDGTFDFDFTGSRFPPSQRAKIAELYKLATENGKTMTPSEIYTKDRLFSSLKRESKYSEIGDIIIDTPNGQSSLFDVFRDIYSSKLDSLSLDLRRLNSEYRKYRQLTDDIEDTLVKSGKFESARGVDPAKYAQTNLRRLLSDAQSATDYQAIADILDSTARQLGYAGARPDDLIQFATDMRKLYPDNIPDASISGILQNQGFAGAAGKVLQYGAPDITDQQNALKELLKTRSNKKSAKSPTSQS